MSTGQASGVAIRVTGWGFCFRVRWLQVEQPAARQRRASPRLLAACAVPGRASQGSLASDCTPRVGRVSSRTAPPVEVARRAVRSPPAPLRVGRASAPGRGQRSLAVQRRCQDGRTLARALPGPHLAPCRDPHRSQVVRRAGTSRRAVASASGVGLCTPGGASLWWRGLRWRCFPVPAMSLPRTPVPRLRLPVRALRLPVLKPTLPRLHPLASSSTVRRLIRRLRLPLLLPLPRLLPSHRSRPLLPALSARTGQRGSAAIPLPPPSSLPSTSGPWPVAASTRPPAPAAPSSATTAPLAPTRRFARNAAAAAFRASTKSASVRASAAVGSGCFGRVLRWLCRQCQLWG